MTKKSQTAEQLLSELNADPEHRRAAEERESQHSKFDAICAADEKELVSEIRDIGYDIESVYDLVNNSPHSVLKRKSIGSYLDAYPMLVEHLEKPHHLRIREGIIRSLTVPDGGQIVENALLSGFQTESDRILKWVFANALRVVMTESRRKKFPEIDAILNNEGAYNKYNGVDALNAQLI